MEQVAFFVGAIGALGGAVAVIALRNPFYRVLALIVHLISLAGLFLVLYAEFIAAAQIVVYAGAVMVLYLFVAAYVGGGRGAALGARFPVSACWPRCSPGRSSSRSPSRSSAPGSRRSSRRARPSRRASAPPPRSAGCCSSAS